MIVPMEKLTALIFYKEKESFLSALQDLGVVHICLEEKDTSNEIIVDMEKRIERCRIFLTGAQKSNRKIRNISNVKPLFKNKKLESIDAFFYVESYERIKTELGLIANRLEKSEREMRNLTPWGDFDINHLRKLKEEVGINARFFISPVKKIKQFKQKDIVLEEISRDRTYVYFVVFAKKDLVGLDCDEFFYPDTDLNSLKEEYEQLREEKVLKETALLELFNYVEAVQKYYNLHKSEYEFLTISNNLNSAVENNVYVINGWVPCSLKKKVEDFLQKKEIYFYFSKPEQTEAIPILLKNNRFARLFEPITKMFSLPNYAELDLTAFFAPFFALFFGFCLGDAGYGLIIFLAALMVRGKLCEDKKPIASLLMILGISTFVFGLISGSLFGIQLFEVQLLKKVVLLDQNRLFYGSLLLGVIQVVFGMCIKAINRIRMYGFLSAVSTFGWIILVIGISRLVTSILLRLPNAQWAVWISYIGVVLILLFNDLKANIFLRIGKGLWELYGITGVFGDVLSYIRLFALGVSTAILGFVFNDIALQCKNIPVIGFALTFVLLVILHSINLILGALSSFVHPLRLTFVEFYKSSGFEGGGKPYNPFRQIK